jgi:peptide/nickel transport system permease protein
MAQSESLNADTIAAPSRTETADAPRSRSISFRILHDAVRSPGLRFGVALFLALLLASLIYPEISALSATKMSVREKFEAPILLGANWTWQHPFGTDQLGRDMLLRSLIGLRYSLLIGSCTVILMFLVGSTLGVIAGFKGGLVDTVIMRITDAQLSIPMIILAIAILGVSRPTVESIVLVLGLSGWPLYARVVRSATQSERGKEFVRGARVIGASDWRIMTRLIMPNVLPPVAFVAVLDVARIMIFEAILGFLGLGLQPPIPSFGNIIADGRKYLINAWWIATSPGAFLALTLVSINLIGAALERSRNRVYGGEA